MGRVDAFPPQNNSKKETVIPLTDVFEKQALPSPPPSSSPEQGMCSFRAFQSPHFYICPALCRSHCLIDHDFLAFAFD